MSRIPSNAQVASSFMDRLRSDDASVGKTTPAQSLRELKQSVLKDLEHLLNTRWRCSSWPPALPELERSLVNYGIPDFSAANLGGAATREEFRKVIERTVRNFEPRFSSVSVQVAPSASPADRTVRFSIEALLLVDPVPERVKFETTLEPTTTVFKVKRVDR